MTRPSSQSRRYARQAAREMLAIFPSASNAAGAMARVIADDVARGHQPHPDDVQAYRLLSRLMSARRAANLTPVSS